MKKPSRFLRLLGVASLLATLLAGVFATSITYAGEGPDPDPSDDGLIGEIWDGTEPDILAGDGTIFFPWVGNDDESTGLGPADTSVSVQNLTGEPAVAFAFVGTHNTDELPATGDWDLVGPFFLAPWASKTFTAAQLGIAEGTGAPVAFSGYNFLGIADEGDACTTNLGSPGNFSLDEDRDINGNDRCTDVEAEVQLVSPVPPAAGGTPQPIRVCVAETSAGDPAPYYDRVAGEYRTWEDADDLQDRLNEVQGEDEVTLAGETGQAYIDPFGGLNNNGQCDDEEETSAPLEEDPAILGGYAKQAVDGEGLPYTSSADSSVSGYNSINGFEIGEFDDWYFPIVQTNGGPGGPWNTILRIANFGQEVDGEIGHIGSAAVTARFFPADDAQGSLDTGFQLQGLLNTGDVWEINVSDYVPEGWIGSVHVYSDSAVFAMADRVKVGDYAAWITNTASNAPYTNANNVAGGQGNFVLFAPDVRFDFFGWNTGINIANLVNEDNNVNVQYFNAFGNAPQTLTRRLAAQGMTFFYDPSIAAQDGSVQDPAADVNADIIGSALIWSDHPVAVAVDATKYPESTTSDDPNIFQAMSYSATANVYTTQAFPLVQKGNPTTGMGATSGINIMNPNSNAAQATVTWINPSGFGADNYGTSAVAIPGFANGFVYTMTQGNLPQGFYGSAILNSTLPVSAVTTQVDYAVSRDGTAVWLGFNPCGFYRDNGGDDTDGPDSNCNFGDPFEVDGGQVTKYVEDENGDPVTGVMFRLVNEAYYQQNILDNETFPGTPWSAGGYSSVNGVVEWTNVPAGDYRLVVEEIPMTEDNDLGDDELPMYEADVDYTEVDGMYVSELFTLNEGDDIVRENVFNRILATKYVELGADAAGVEVCLHADDDGDGELSEDEVASPEDCDVADAEGDVVFEDVEPGTYWVSVNQGLEFDQVAGFTPAVFGPETFVLGGVYVNDLADDVEGAEGNIQKVLVLPESLIEAGPENVSILGIISIYGPGADPEVDDPEVEGNVQTRYLPDIGPNGEGAFAITDFNVPVGGPYTIVEDLAITYDLDGEGGDDPVTVFTGEITLTEAVDGQVVCDDYLDLSDDCEASPTDPEIYVFEDQTTRVFNDLTDIVEGQLDVFVRDEETEEPLEDALVCVYDESVAPAELVACDLTDVDGQAEFPGLGAGFYALTIGHPNYEIQGSGTFFYLPEFDQFLGGGMDDELGDIDPILGQQDLQLALDPVDAIMGVEVAELVVNGAALQGTTAPAEGAEVRVYLAEEFDEDAGACISATLVAVGETDANGFVEFGVSNDTAYCVIAGENLELISEGASLAGPPADVPWLESPVEAGVYNEGPTPFEDFDPAEDVDVVLEIEPIFEPVP